jgi:hypothetical protein
MDARCGRTRPQLLDKLVARAHELIDIDPPAAQRFVESAFALDPSHAGARDLHRFLQDSGSRRPVAVEEGPDRVAPHPEMREFQPVMDTVLLGAASKTEILPVNGDAITAPLNEPPPVVVSKPRRTIVNRWVALSALALLVVAGAVVLTSRPRPAPQPPERVAFQIHITPAGASVYLKDKIIGTSDSRIILAPGAYSFQIAKEGYQSKIVPIELRAGRSAQPVSVTLDPLPQKLKISTDLKAGKVSLDGATAADLDANGELLVEVAAPGKHTLQIESGAKKASVSFETSPLALPAIAKPEASAGLDVVLVSAYRDRASIQTTLGTVPAHIEDRDAGSIAANGLELNDLTSSSHDLTLGTGARAWNGEFDSGPEPSLSVFVRSGVHTGMIVVDVPGPDGAEVVIDGGPKGFTKNGIIRRNVEPGTHSIRVTREGYLEGHREGIVVQKGGFVRVAIFLTSPIVPRPSQSIDKLPTPTGKLMLEVSPSSAKVKYQRIGEAAWHEAASNELVLEIGSYLIAASAPEYADKTESVTVEPGPAKTAPFTLQKVIPKPPPPEASMDAKDWSKPWSKAGGWFARSGGDFVLYNTTPAIGVFHFTAQPKKSFLGGGKARWVLNYLDDRNYILFELDKNYSRGVFRDGKRIGRPVKKNIGAAADYFNIELAVTPKRIAVKLLLGDKSSDVLDEWEPSDADLTKGHFGFYLPGETQMLLANFSFIGQ